MRFEPPLSTASLDEIQARNLASADVVKLLCEIARLRATILCADQLQRVLGELGGPQCFVLGALRGQLIDEPCVQEFLRLLSLEQLALRIGETNV